MCSIYGQCGLRASTDESLDLRLLQSRGPDSTTEISIDGITVRHDLLNINSNALQQPLVRREQAVLFNGQIYGSWERSGGGHYRHRLQADDLSFLADQVMGISGRQATLNVSRLEGEFVIALVDLMSGKTMIWTDSFATKPVSVFAYGQDAFEFCSYSEAVPATRRARATEQVINVPAETVVTVGSGISVKRIPSHFSFSPATRASSYDSRAWRAAFSGAISRRTSQFLARDGGAPFIPMSGGADSGAIVAEAISQGLDFYVYCAPEGEDSQIIEKRIKLLDKHRIPYELVFPTNNEVAEAQGRISAGFEDFRVQASGFPNHYQEPFLSRIPGFVVSGVIFARARARGLRTCISGVGADEIFTDYASGSMNLSSMRGNWKLADKKWLNFGGGWQSMFLQAGERVAGQYGIEARYPFLDKEVVSEFLRLPIPGRYEPLKRPVNDLLNEHDFPTSAVKRGFLGTKL